MPKSELMEFIGREEEVAYIDSQIKKTNIHAMLFLRGAGGDYEVQLKNGKRLRVSRSRREELEKRLGM